MPLSASNLLGYWISIQSFQPVAAMLVDLNVKLRRLVLLVMFDVPVVVMVISEGSSYPKIGNSPREMPPSRTTNEADPLAASNGNEYVMTSFGTNPGRRFT